MQYINVKDKYNVTKITLGTAQLGLSYGINPIDQVSTDAEVREILKYAFANGINSIDTAPNYRDSERRIGEFIRQNELSRLFLITRLGAQDFLEEIWESKNLLSLRVGNELRLSCMRLGLARIPTYIVHFADQAFRDDGAILGILTKLKGKGFIEFIGTSLYTDGELERCIGDKRIDVVQIPFNVLDRRLLESGLLGRASERGLIIFARSVFLQGLVFMQYLPLELRNARETIGGLHHLANNHHMSIAELCLRYVLSINEISSAVIGVDNLDQLKENVRIASSGPLDKDILKEIERLPQMPADLVDIRSWGQRFDFGKY